MLDSETKRHINNARDILVGKVTDPKSQVDLITTALIYKFMDDMDLAAVEEGGKRSFFVKGLEKFAFSRIMAPKVGAQDRMDLFSDCLEKLPFSNSIPELFRAIFKGAALPFRDPQTLTLFLSEIANFSYDNSENLGNAFEYLLSIMGSQGDAGQFRTPRHIIDFIVQVVNPQKSESILDPACGTAGFLISAFLHVKNGNKNLSPKDIQKFVAGIAGYDIDPGMRKLAQANLYLHGFAEPRIFEYDTLSNDERWGEKFDVILANPPFMTPKGGIRPHSKFSVQANRAEVLFVDYIAEHLSVNGRAGIIVPEGIVFKNDSAYKALRKMLVEDSYLWAVVSLPAGVFQPYSGVKTSILFLDRRVAKNKRDILFVKIENDGFDLGAQRRKIEKNDLPKAVKELNDFAQNIKTKSHFLIVSKSKIVDGFEYNLTAGRYEKEKTKVNEKYDIVKLGDVCELEYGKALKKTNRIAGVYPVYGSNGIVDYNNEFIVKAPFIIVGRKGSVGKINYSDRDGYPIDTAFFIRETEKINIKYLYYILKTINLSSLKIQAGVPGLNRNDAYKIKIPLPPLEIQQKIVEEIENKQQAIDYAQRTIEALSREREYFVGLLNGIECEEVMLGDVCEIKYGFTDTAKEKGNVRFIRITDIDDNGYLKENDKKYLNLTKENKEYSLNKNDLLVARTGATFGKTLIFKSNEPAIYASYLIKLNFDNSKILNAFYWYFSRSEEYWKQANNLVSGGGQPQFNGNAIKQIKIPLPSLVEQKRIVAEFDEKQKIIEANERLVEIMKKEIERVMERVYR